MPYTPPSHQSPASSKNSSPAISRTSSYTEDVPRSPMTSRPQPPRSMSSASYLHKHRRSPSIPKSDGAPPTPLEGPESHIQATDFAHNGSVRQSPPPVNNLLIPTGAVLSPPDSSENSDGDEAHNEPRGRDLERNWEQLKEAVRGIDQRRESSPDKDNSHLRETISEPHSQATSPTALSAEARKIAHSRSSTETAISLPPKTTSFAEPSTPTSDESEDDQGPLSKPSLVRKKSGELVKPALRPSSRRRYSSMPGTPTYSKSVHFNDNGNQTRHFLTVDKPIAVSAGTSPVEQYESETEFPFEVDAKYERDIKLANFPADSFERKTKPIRVERIFLSADKQTLIGTCAVQNISFHKLVVARFTVDYWKTTSEVVAEYNNIGNMSTADGCDRFNFHIKLSDQANIDEKTLLLCVRYSVGGQEFWDNNDDKNYQVDFTKATQSPSKSAITVNPGAGQRPLNAIPRSRHSPSNSRSQNGSIDDDFATRFDNSSAYHFGTADLCESPTAIKLKPRTKRGSIFPTSQGSQAANGLGGRYDFGASLSAALSTAQDKLGRQSGLMNGTAPAKPNSGSYFGIQERRGGPAKNHERPEALTTTDRPAMGSDQYRDLVQKFCYFTPGTGKPPGSPQPQGASSSTAPPAARVTDGASESVTPSPSSSGTITPPQQVDGSNDRASEKRSPFVSRSGSPIPATGQGLADRSASPMRLGYPYHSNVRDGYLSDSQTPTAIHG